VALEYNLFENTKVNLEARVIMNQSKIQDILKKSGYNAKGYAILIGCHSEACTCIEWLLTDEGFYSDSGGSVALNDILGVSESEGTIFVVQNNQSTLRLNAVPYQNAKELLELVLLILRCLMPEEGYQHCATQGELIFGLAKIMDEAKQKGVDRLKIGRKMRCQKTLLTHINEAFNTAYTAEDILAMYDDSLMKSGCSGIAFLVNGIADYRREERFIIPYRDLTKEDIVVDEIPYDIKILGHKMRFRTLTEATLVSRLVNLHVDYLTKEERKEPWSMIRVKK